MNAGPSPFRYCSLTVPQSALVFAVDLLMDLTARLLVYLTYVKYLARWSEYGEAHDEWLLPRNTIAGRLMALVGS